MLQLLADYIWWIEPNQWKQTCQHIAGDLMLFSDVMGIPGKKCKQVKHWTYQMKLNWKILQTKKKKLMIFQGDLLMECHLEADPQPTIAWQHSGNLLEPSGRVVQTLTPLGGSLYKATLVIKVRHFWEYRMSGSCGKTL